MIQASEIRRRVDHDHLSYNVPLASHEALAIADALDELGRVKTDLESLMFGYRQAESLKRDEHKLLQDEIKGLQSKILYQRLSYEHMEALEARNRALVEALRQAHKTLSAGGHEPGCKFDACTCGAVEGFKAERTEFYRRYNALANDAKEKP